MRVVANAEDCERFRKLTNEELTNAFENRARVPIKKEWKDNEPLLRRLRQSCYLDKRDVWLSPKDRLKKQYETDGLVLFLGAGVSCGSGIPNWVELSAKVGAPPPKELGSDKTTELLEEWVSAGKRADELLKVIRNKGQSETDAQTLERAQRDAASLLGVPPRTLAAGCPTKGDAVKRLLQRFEQLFEHLVGDEKKFLTTLYDGLYGNLPKDLKKLLKELPKKRDEQPNWQWECFRKVLAKNESLAAVGDLLVLKDGTQWRRNPQIHAVLTVNADNLVQLYCQARAGGHRLVTQVDRASVGDHPDRTPVCHLHGILDIRGENFTRTKKFMEFMKGDLLPDVVFRKSEYDETLADPTSFVNVTPQSYMQRLNVLFFGTSLDDPNICRWLRSSYRERVAHRTKYLRELYRDRYGAAQAEAEWESVRHFWLRNEKEGDSVLPDTEKKKIEREKRELGVQVVWCKDYGQACLRCLKESGDRDEPHVRSDFGRRRHLKPKCWCNE